MKSFCKTLCCCFSCCSCCRKTDYYKDIRSDTLLLPKKSSGNGKGSGIADYSKAYIYGTVCEGFSNFNFNLSKFSNGIIKKVVCGDSHCLILFSDGNMFGVGNNIYGQLGQKISKNTNLNELTLLKVDLSFNQLLKNSEFSIVDIAAGSNFSLVLIKSSKSKTNTLLRFGINEKDKYNDGNEEIQTIVSILYY